MSFEPTFINGNFDDPLETATFAKLRMVFADQVVSRCFDKRAGSERDYINIALYPLALGVAKNWWSLLYEPRKSDQRHALVEARHSLDALTTGFMFPAMSIWSNGLDGVSVEIPEVRQEFSPVEFLPLENRDVSVAREEVEASLYTLIDRVAARVPAGAGDELRSMWERLRHSFGDAEERQYCMAAGRLGLDPYGSDAPDLAELSEGLSERLFSDVCDALTPAELVEGTAWAREGVARLATVDDVVSGLGVVTPYQPNQPVWEDGYEAARALRRNLNLEDVPARRVVDALFGNFVRSTNVSQLVHPLSLQGIVGRDGDALKIALPNVAARMRRSTLCRALYVAWRTNDGDASAVTTAATVNQQGGRAFAAELLAPAEQLRQRAGEIGLTEDAVEAIARENVCPTSTVIWNAYNNKIPLRGVELPRTHW